MKKKQPLRIKVKGRGGDLGYDVTIGLEVHARLNSRAKLFCACPAHFGAVPNENICPVCAGLPGSLPVINREAVAMGIRAALALNLNVQPASVFARKNYFYPDLPKGYQISQYAFPLASDGHLDILDGGEVCRIGIERAHLEEDAGKLVHTGAEGIAGASGALVDLNRAGTPLLEIVSRPEICSPGQAAQYVKTLRETLVFAGAIEGHMEEGGLRCDANISLKPKGRVALGVKVEIKNLNSFKFLQRALEHEIERQKRLLAKGGQIVQETRGFDPAEGTTFSMRKKEEAHDYRYFPEPDLLPLEATPEMVADVEKAMPELPRQKRAKYRDWGLAENQIELLLGDVATARLFEECVGRTAGDHADFAKWFLNVFVGELNMSEYDMQTMRTEAGAIARVYDMKINGRISEKSVAQVLARCIAEGTDPEKVVSADNLEVVEDTGQIEAAIEKVVAANQTQVADYLAGSEKIFNFLVGQVMRELKGRADVKSVAAKLHAKLD